MWGRTDLTTLRTSPTKPQGVMPGLQKEPSGHENMVQVELLVRESEPLVALDNEVVDQGTKKFINKFENWDMVTENGGVRK